MQIYIDSSETHVSDIGAYVRIVCEQQRACTYACDLMHTDSLTFGLKADTWVRSEIQGALRKYLHAEPGCILFYPELTGHKSSDFLHRHTFLIGLDRNQGGVLP